MEYAMRMAIQEIISAYQYRINDEKIFFHPYIPPKKLENAIRIFGGGEDTEDIRVLVDNTVFGNAKDGLLLTESFLHVHNMLEKPFHLPINEIKDVRFQEGVMESVVWLNGDYVFKSNMPTKANMALFAEMLREIIGMRKSGPEGKRDATSIQDSLSRLKSLFDADLISKEEYEEKRKAYVAQL